MPIMTCCSKGDFVTFELETLMGMGPKVIVPVAHLSVPPHRSAARRQAHAHHHR